MSDPEFHEQYPEEFDDALAVAHGAVIGWIGGKGGDMPKLTTIQAQAYRHAFAEVFNAGVELGRKAAA